MAFELPITDASGAINAPASYWNVALSNNAPQERLARIQFYAYADIGKKQAGNPPVPGFQKSYDLSGDAFDDFWNMAMSATSPKDALLQACYALAKSTKDVATGEKIDTGETVDSGQIDKDGKPIMIPKLVPVMKSYFDGAKDV